MIVDNCVA